jgi:hypothetical protein
VLCCPACILTIHFPPVFVSVFPFPAQQRTHTPSAH